MRVLLASSPTWSFYLYIAIAGIFALGFLAVVGRFIYLRWVGGNQPSVQITTVNHQYNAQGQEMQWQGQGGGSIAPCDTNGLIHPLLQSTGSQMPYPYPYQQYPPEGQNYSYPPWGSAPAIGMPVTPSQAPIHMSTVQIGEQPSVGEGGGGPSALQYPTIAPQGDLNERKM